MVDALGTDLENERAIGYLHTDVGRIPFSGVDDLNIAMYECLEKMVLTGKMPEDDLLLHATLLPNKDGSPINLKPYLERFKVGKFGDFGVDKNPIIFPSDREKDGDITLFYTLDIGKSLGRNTA